MTTLIIDIRDSIDAKKIADALRLMSSVIKITVEEDEQIPAIPCTQEELIRAVEQSEEDIRAGRVITHEELKKQISSW